MLLGWGEEEEEEERGLASWRERKGGGGGARSRPVLKGGKRGPVSSSEDV